VDLGIPNFFPISLTDFLACLFKVTICARFLGVKSILKRSESLKATKYKNGIQSTALIIKLKSKINDRIGNTNDRT